MIGAGRAVGPGEVLRELLGVDRRRGDDDLQVGSARQQLLEVAEDEVDVEGALVGLVDDDRVVLAQVPVPLHLVEQDAVGHHLHEGVVARLVGEAHLVADGRAELDLELLGDPLGDRPRRDAPRLGVPDQALGAPADLEADLGQLGGLPRAGLAGNDDDLVLADGRGDVVLALDHGQVLGIAQLWHRDRPAGPALRPGRRPAARPGPIGAAASGAAPPLLFSLPRRSCSRCARPSCSGCPLPGARGLVGLGGGHGAQHTSGHAAGLSVRAGAPAPASAGVRGASTARS